MAIYIEDLISELYQNITDQIEYENKLLDYRHGSLVIKTRRKEEYYYLTYRSGKKVKTDYLGKLTKPNLTKIKKELEEAKEIKIKLKKLQKSESEIRRLIKAVDKNYLIKNIYEVMDIIVIIRPILKEFKLGKVYLYGSYARGNSDENSDINIYCDKPEKPIRELINKIEKETNKKVNVVTTSSKIPESILKEINNHKILIYRGN